MALYKHPVTRIDYVGDHDLCATLRRRAIVEVGILEKLMRFQGISQDWRTVEVSPGVFIECWSCFGLRQIVITTPTKGEKKKRSMIKCFCNGCLSLARVLNVRHITFANDNPLDESDNLCIDRVTAYPERSKYFCGYVVYDVEACTGSVYSLFEGIGALDNTPFCVGDYGLVMPWPHIYEMLDVLDTKCFKTCQDACFIAPGSPVISVMLLQVDASKIPIWIANEEEDGHP